jgi:DNA-binding XRE family transcriptional regulator
MDIEDMDLLGFEKAQLERIMYESSIGGKINTLRTKVYMLTQKEFADMIQVSHAHISKIESNKDSPSNSLLTVILNKFNVNEDWINDSVGDSFSRLRDSDYFIFRDLSIFVSNVKHLQKKLGLTKRELLTVTKRLSERYGAFGLDTANDASFHYDNIDFIKLKGMHYKVIQGIAEYFGVPIYDIVNTSMITSITPVETDSMQMTKEEQTILEIYNTCSSDDKRLIFELVKKFI